MSPRWDVVALAFVVGCFIAYACGCGGDVFTLETPDAGAVVPDQDARPLVELGRIDAHAPDSSPAAGGDASPGARADTSPVHGPDASPAPDAMADASFVDVETGSSVDASPEASGDAGAPDATPGKGLCCDMMSAIGPQTCGTWGCYWTGAGPSACALPGCAVGNRCVWTDPKTSNNFPGFVVACP